jgi:tetratricopeptide (TPR) repeat protein
MRSTFRKMREKGAKLASSVAEKGWAAGAQSITKISSGLPGAKTPAKTDQGSEVVAWDNDEHRAGPEEQQLKKKETKGLCDPKAQQPKKQQPQKSPKVDMIDEILIEEAKEDAGNSQSAPKSGKWERKPGVTYRQYDGKGSHFNLGLTLEEIETALEDMLPWGSYKRDESRFLGADGKCWNNSEGKNGYDLGEVVRDFLRSNGFEDLSIAEVLWSEGRKGVGEATVFFSHIQQLPVETAVETLREASVKYHEEMGVNPRFFIDYMGIRQAAKGDFDLTVVRRAIHDIPRLLVELDAAKDSIGNAAPIYFSRSFCLIEVFAAVEHGSSNGKVLVFGPAVKDPKTAPWLAAKVDSFGYNVVNSCNGQCRWADEKKKIDAFIEESVGYAELDRIVGEAVANGCTYGLQAAAATDPSNVNVAAFFSVQAADLTDEQLEQFCEQRETPRNVRAIDLQQCEKLTCIDGLSRWGFSQLEELGEKWLSDTLKLLGKYKEAIEHYKKALEIAQERGDRGDEGSAYSSIGDALDSLGNHEEAMEHYEKSLEIAQETSNRGEEGSTYNGIATALDSLGKHEEPMEYLKKALEIAQETGDRGEEGKAHSNIGDALGSLEKHKEAMEHYEKGLEIAQETGNRVGEAMTYNGIATALDSLAKHEEAIEYLKTEEAS